MGDIMKRIASVTCLFIALSVAQAAEKPLPDKLIDVTIDHITKNGPDSDVAQFISMSGHVAWLRREEFVGLVAPYLKDKDPAKVAGAIEVLYRLRGYCPMESIGDSFEKESADFFSRLDKLVCAQFEHYHSLKNNGVYHNLALFLGGSRSKDSRSELMKIATSTTDNEQALICLAWHRDPQDMEFLFPFMCADTSASRSLPYHFRNSYGALATPYLKRALKEAKSTSARAEAALELVRLDEEEGFDGLRSLILAKPKSPEKTPQSFDFVRQRSEERRVGKEC
jgi:hypothetical protein